MDNSNTNRIIKQKRPQSSIRLDPQTHEDLHTIAKHVGIDKATLMRRALEEYVDKVKQEGEVSIRSTIPAFRSGSR